MNFNVCANANRHPGLFTALMNVSGLLKDFDGTLPHPDRVQSAEHPKKQINN